MSDSGSFDRQKLKPDHVIFNTLINACGRAGAIERAFDVLADMKGEPFHLIPDHVTIGALISACARAGQVMLGCVCIQRVIPVVFFFKLRFWHGTLKSFYRSRIVVCFCYFSRDLLSKHSQNSHRWIELLKFTKTCGNGVSEELQSATRLRFMLAAPQET